jgi:hypothetical protein
MVLSKVSAHCELIIGGTGPVTRPAKETDLLRASISSTGLEVILQ